MYPLSKLEVEKKLRLAPDDAIFCSCCLAELEKIHQDNGVVFYCPNVMCLNEDKFKRFNVVQGRDIFMDDKDFLAARQNRERQIVVYPNTKELTDVSKAMLRSSGAKGQVPRVISTKQAPVYNSQTHSFKFV